MSGAVVIAFPPRDAGQVLAQALAAAAAAGEAEAQRRQHETLTPWGGRDPTAAEWVRAASLEAAKPILRSLTADTEMVSIVAFGLAEDVMIRLRKRGLA